MFMPSANLQNWGLPIGKLLKSPAAPLKDRQGHRSPDMGENPLPGTSTPDHIHIPCCNLKTLHPAAIAGKLRPVLMCRRQTCRVRAAHSEGTGTSREDAPAGKMRQQGANREGTGMEYGFFGWIIIGLIAGALAKWVMPGKDPGGLIVTILIGIAGGILGGFLANSLPFLGTGGTIWNLVLATAGAVLLLWIYRMVKSRSS